MEPKKVTYTVWIKHLNVNDYPENIFRWYRTG